MENCWLGNGFFLELITRKLRWTWDAALPALHNLTLKPSDELLIRTVNWSEDSTSASLKASSSASTVQTNTAAVLRTPMDDDDKPENFRLYLTCCYETHFDGEWHHMKLDNHWRAFNWKKSFRWSFQRHKKAFIEQEFLETNSKHFPGNLPCKDSFRLIN